MKVKINKDGKAKEFKLINKWEDVTIETYSKLMTFTNGTKSSEALETLTELSNIPKELLKQLELKHIVLMLEKLSHLQSQEDTTLKNIIEIDGVRYGFHPDFDEMTLGEYADIESFIKSGADKHLPEIMAVLYRPIKEEVDGVYTIEAYDGNIKIRTEVMRKMSATQVHSALVFFLSFQQRIVNDFAIIFDGSASGNEDAIASESFADKWSWFGVMYRLTNADISKLDAITRLPLLECLTWLSYETDLNVQNKVKLNSN
jgi:hypothetical protein